jgi:hypothetical protein
MLNTSFGLAILFLALVSLGAPADNPATDLSELGWMVGNWTGVADGLTMEELWLQPKGNTMLALHRDIKAGRTVSFEFLRIEATTEGITYWASPQGKPATPFRLVELGHKRVVFENPSHDFPRRIIYWLGRDSSLHAKIEGTLKGLPAAEEWKWRRTPEERSK